MKKNNLFSVILTVFNMCIFSIFIYAQESPGLGEGDSRIMLNEKIVLRYNDEASVMLKLEDFDIARTFKIYDEYGTILTQVTSMSNSLFVNGLTYGTKYFWGYNDINSGVEIMNEIEIYPSFDEGLSVSPFVFQALVDFGNQTESDLQSFLANYEGIEAFELYSILQRHYKQASDSHSQFSDMGVTITETPPVIPTEPPVPPTETECVCNVATTAGTATPNGGLVDGFFLVDEVEELDPKGKFNNDASYWHYRTEKGPAKAHLIWTDGWKAGGNYYAHEFSNYSESNSTISPVYAQLNYNLFCTDLDGLPGDCGCSAKLSYKYSYDTYMRTKAIIKSGGGTNKKADAVTEDMVFIIEEEEDGSTTVIDAGHARTVATCSQSVNTEWFVNLLGLVGTIVDIYYGDLDAESINDLIDDLIVLINTNLTNRSEECGDYEEELALLNSQRVRNLLPNTPVEIKLFSITNQKVGGKRSWDSSSFVVSDFLLGGIATEMDCCLNPAASWVFSSAHGSPVSSHNLNELLGNYFYIRYPDFDIPINLTGGYQLPSEAFATHDNICPIGGGGMGVVAPDSNDHILGSGINLFSVNENDDDVEYVGLFDISGKKVLDLKNVTIEDLDKFKVDLQSNLFGNGIFILSYLKNGELKSEKISLSSK